ncbi:hypothetical protein F3I62_18955 [Pseudomonas sp. R-28-1W-6]|uniref:hypothetical protein n=1 Tax=Pseudomonas sp. R-28-1W-6 TaxID=2650101 RepID=UPI00136577BA|nr:hypothetical protein [Pseudomonas sp. R-28-1W-6]MWV14185.1 hypothetical protein [Pseudomonas sp. R-28-1W-6]
MSGNRTYFSPILDLIRSNMVASGKNYEKEVNALTSEFNKVLDGDISQKAVDVFVNIKTDRLKRAMLEYDMGEMGVDLEAATGCHHNGDLDAFARSLILCAEMHIILEFISVINDVDLVKHPEFVCNYIPHEVLVETVVGMAKKVPSISRYLSFSSLLGEKCQQRLDNIYYDYCLD